MKKYLLLTGALLVLAVVLAACGGKTTQSPTEAPVVVTTAPTDAATMAPVALIGDALLGGKLYDSWIDELAAEAPADAQPLWSTSTTAAGDVAPEETWLCVSCHGVDYNGDNGFPGILADAGKDPNEILAILKGSTNPDHDFSSVLDDQQLADIALFTNQYVIDITSIVKDGKAVNGIVDSGKKLFDDTCTDCHGSQAIAINFHSDTEPEYPASIANENPAELLGKVRFGVPGMPDMPSGIDNGWTDQDFANIISYIATLPTSSPITEGGRMYDSWIEATGSISPTTDQPLWATQTVNTDLNGADTWACSTCHGFDYSGNNSFPGILSAKDKSSDELMTTMTTGDHDFSSVLDASELGRIISFIQQGANDRSAYTNADGTVNGDAAHGKILFNSVCKICHGEDGRAINFAGEGSGETEYLGNIAVNEPFGFYHIATFGKPGQPMPAGINLGWSPEFVADVLAYAQTLPLK